MDEQIVLEDFQRVPGDDHIHWPIRTEDHQLGGISPACDSRDYIERRGVNPVEIFQDQEQWAFRRHRFQYFANLTHHSFARGAENIALQALSLFRWDKRRELNQPSGRQGSPFVCRMSAFRLAKQLADRFEQRVIRFLSAEPFNALSPRNAQAGTSYYTAAERVNQRRFAN